MDINERREKILAIEDEFSNIGDALKSYMREFHDIHTSLNNQNSELNQKIINILPILENSQSNINILLDDVNTIKEHVKQLETKVNENQNTIDTKNLNNEPFFRELSTQMQIFQEQIQNLTDASASLNKGMIELQNHEKNSVDNPNIVADISNLQISLNNVESSLRALQNEYANEKSDIVELKGKNSKIDDIINQITHLDTVIQENESVLLSGIRNIEPDLQICRNQIEKLDEKLQQITDINQKLDEINATFKGAAENLQSLSQIKEEVSILKPALKPIENSINDIENEFICQRKELEELKGKLVSIEEIELKNCQSLISCGELTSKIEKMEDSNLTLIQNSKSIENSIISQMNAFNTTLTNRDNHIQATIKSQLVEFQMYQNTVKSDIEAFNQTLSENSRVIHSGTVPNKL